MLTNKEKLGKIGEEIVSHFLNGTLSENKYDDKKDMIVDGKFVEVKTQPRWKKENSFTVDESKTQNNFFKCLTVDRLIFVEPGKNDEIRIFECTDRSYRIMHPRKIETYLFDVSKMKLLISFKNHQICEQMISLSNTPRCWLS
jgi:hypothetical protein